MCSSRCLEDGGCLAFAAVYLAALRKIDFLNHLQWLLARLVEPGVKARCLELWAAAPGAEHHRVSAIFLSPSGELGALVEAISEDGSNVAPALQHEIGILAGVPTDDTAAEGPHSIVKRIKSSATAANFPWLSSSARMEQNMIDVEGLREGRGASSLQAVWDSFTSVLRPPQRRPSYQVMRMNRKEFERRVYTIQHMEGFSVDIEDDGDDDDGDAGGDGHDGSAGGVVESASDKTKRILLKDFLANALQTHSFLSLPCKQPDGSKKLAFYQVLDVAGKGIFVEAVGSKVQNKEGGLCMASLQPLEVWSPEHRAGIDPGAIPA